MTEIDYLAIFKESFTLVILAFCSILSIAFTLERWWFFRKAQVDGEELLTSVRKFLEGGKPESAQEACIRRPSPVAHVIHYGLVNRKHSREELEQLLST